jgi:hypothetical protein
MSNWKTSWEFAFSPRSGTAALKTKQMKILALNTKTILSLHALIIAGV